MCGRARRTIPVATLAQLTGVDPADIDPADNPDRNNLAPTQKLLVVRHSLSKGKRVAESIRWGLVPSWSKDPKKRPIINARGETVRKKPSFRSAFKKRRCLIPLSGYYEWRRLDKKTKIPYHFTTTDAEESGGFCVAGLWEVWRNKEDPTGEDSLVTCTIITTEANTVAGTVHDRMPVILKPEDYATWLDPETDPDEAEALLQPWPDDGLTKWRVSTRVNSSRNEGPELAEPVPDEGE